MYPNYLKTTFILFVFVLSVFCIPTAQSQETPNPTPVPQVVTTLANNEVIICFASDTAGTEPFAIAIQNITSDLTSPLFGLVFPQSGVVTVSSTSRLRAALFSIDPSNMTGGYSLGDYIMFAQTSENIPPASDNDPCRTDFLSTVPMRVSPNHMIAIQIGTGNNFVNPVMRGVFAFYFEEQGKGFQIVQFNRNENIEMKFPFLTGTTHNRYIVVSNAYAKLGQSATRGGNTIISERDLLDRFSLETELENKQFGLDLYEIMDQSSVHIYPYCGEFRNYEPGEYVRLSALSAAPLKDRFSVDTPVHSVRNGGEFPFAIMANPNENYGTATISTGKFKEFDADGRMVVNTDSGGVVVRENIWYMESDGYIGCLP